MARDCISAHLGCVSLVVAQPGIGDLLAQVSWLRKSLFESLVMYTICQVSRVFPDGNLLENLRMTTPRILIPLFFIVIHGMHLHGDGDQITLT